MDSFTQNIEGVSNLVNSDVNKTNLESGLQENAIGEQMDVLALDLSDEELLQLKDEYEANWNSYGPKIKPRQDKNKLYYAGKQRSNGIDTDAVISSNLIFEAEETYIPQALSKNPEPVVWSDNTEEGKAASNDIKTMLQSLADTFLLRKKLGLMVRQHSIYFIAVLKYGWDKKTNDISIEVRKPQNFVFDKDGYVDEFGDFHGKFVGEKCETTAEKLIEEYPKHKEYVFLKVNGKLGTNVVYTEWHNDEFTFTTFQDKVLDKHKNEFFNYPDAKGTSATPLMNHFAQPKMNYTFLSVYSLQEQPFDITNLIEQNIANQNRITDRDEQISKNLASANNGVILDPTYFTAETAAQARDSFFEEGFILGNPAGVKRLEANEIPSSVFTAQENDKTTLRAVFGTQGIATNSDNKTETARGMILDQSHDSTRIGGGIGDALEQVARSAFNYITQMMYVFYDEPHYGAVMGNGQAVELAQILNSNINRHFVVSVSPNSMAPKDEISQINNALQRWESKAIDPIGLMKELNDPDPMNSAKRLVLWSTNPQAYAATYFPEQAPAAQAPQQGGGSPPQGGEPVTSLAAEPANASLKNVPLNSPA